MADTGNISRRMARNGDTQIPKKRIGELLISEGLITEKQLEEALKMQGSHGGKVVENLVALGYLDLRTFVTFLAKQPGVASIDISNYEVPRELASLIPREFAYKHEVFPIDKLGRLLTVGMACPLDSATIQHLEEITGLKVKPVLCSVTDITATIRRYYPDDALYGGEAEEYAELAGLADAESVEQLESSMRLGNVASMLRQLESLPALPDTVEQVRAAMEDPDSSTSDVARIIGVDPQVAAKMLSVANSAAYGFPNRVDNITMAVTLLGLRETYSIVLSCSVINMLDGNKHFDYKRFWETSLHAAGAARIVAREKGVRQMGGVFAAGLLHDIGRVALAEVIPDQYAQLDQNVSGGELIAAEQHLLGLAHPEAGYMLAEYWGLPGFLCETIRFHHRPEYAENARELVLVVGLADVLTEARSQEGEKEYVLAHGASYIEGLGIDEAVVQDLLDSVLAMPPVEAL